jgi:hypothetical protein
VRAAALAHVFLFRCPACHGAVPAVCFNSEYNLETADAYVFRPHCECGWTGELVGFMAIGHWVQEWESVAVETAKDCSISREAA